MSSIISNNDDIFERFKLEKKLRAKYEKELSQASWWRRFLIEIRIRREASRALRNQV